MRYQEGANGLIEDGWLFEIRKVARLRNSLEG